MQPPNLSSNGGAKKRGPELNDHQAAEASRAAMKNYMLEKKTESIIPLRCCDVIRAKRVENPEDEREKLAVVSWWSLFDGARCLKENESVCVVISAAEYDERASHAGNSNMYVHEEYKVCDWSLPESSNLCLRVVLFQHTDAIELKSPHGEKDVLKAALGADIEYWNKHGDHIDLLEKLIAYNDMKDDEPKDGENLEEERDMAVDDERRSTLINPPPYLKLFGKLKLYETTKWVKLNVHRVVPVNTEAEYNFHMVQCEYVRQQYGVSKKY